MSGPLPGQDDEGSEIVANDEEQDTIFFTSESRWTTHKQKPKSFSRFVILICVLVFLTAFLAYVVFDQAKASSDAHLISEIQDRLKRRAKRLNATIYKQIQIDSEVNQTNIVVNGMQDSLSLLPEEVAKEASTYKMSINQSLTMFQVTMTSRHDQLEEVEIQLDSLQQALGQTKPRVDDLQEKANTEGQRLNSIYSNISAHDIHLNTQAVAMGLLQMQMRFDEMMVNVTTADIKQHLQSGINSTGDVLTGYLEDLAADITLHKSTLNQSISVLTDQLIFHHEQVNQTQNDLNVMKVKILENLDNATKDEIKVYWLVSPRGRYSFTFAQARDACEERNDRLATMDELLYGFNQGLDQCNCGWLDGNKVAFPIQYPRPGCFKDRKPGVRTCTWQSTWDAWCFKA